MIPYGSLVIYATPKKRRYIRRLEEGEVWHTSDGSLAAATVAEAEFGAVIPTSLGMPVRIERVELTDLLMGIKRKTQIIYPKDIAWICLKLGAGPDRTILEAGCGSGGLTLALSWFCGPTGRVISHESREEFARLARRNLDWAGLGKNVEIFTRDIESGFMAPNADGLFLDVREPWKYLDQAAGALRPGASAGFLVPTAGQASRLIEGLEEAPFDEIEMCEILVRPWKPLADRLRPADRMIAHTGFLLFARCQARSPEFESWLPPGTRERKQLAAREEKKSPAYPG